MNWRELKIGDVITITSIGGMWSSKYSGNCPLKANIFPYTAEIFKISDNTSCALVGEYGWALDFITYALKINYEIY